MLRHVRTVHESTYPAMCNICGEKFRDKYNVKVHKKATHYYSYNSDEEADAENRVKKLPEGVTAYQAWFNRAKESERERESAQESAQGSAQGSARSASSR